MIRNNPPVGTATTVELRASARPENVGLARLALRGVAAVAGMALEDVADMKLAVSEACTNAVLHAYPDGNGGEMVVRYTVDADELTVEIIDTGVGFDPSDAELGPIRTPPEEHMGLAIARAVTDRLEIDSGPTGTRVVLAKRLVA